MSGGLQIFDQNGNTILDATYRVLRIIGSAQVFGGSPGSVTDSRLSQGCFVCFQGDKSAGEGYLNHGVIDPVFSVNGDVLSWTYPAQNGTTFNTYVEGILFYGAY
ncbi:hypothetical protein D0B32_10935 [Paraburkholderia sp. DHOC27]|nr:hypothetical protein D0B32_10935 [Paraburkholderia sp. DHOC27]